jgi:ATP-dependent RNA helicase DeaD
MPPLSMSDLNLETPEADESSSPTEYVADISFDDMKLSDSLRRAVKDRGYEHPTPVQARAFAPVVAGKDLIVRSKTGTGKTAAFALPLLERVAEGERRVRALVLCPTRELAIQVANEISDLGKYKDVKVTAIYGGASMKTQEDALDYGSAFIVGTPGRIIDHIRRGNLKLQECEHVVLDEADEMLNQGFYEDVTRILDFLPKSRQVLLFSATVPTDIQNLIARYTTNAETLLLSGDVFTVEHIQHVRYDVSDDYPKPRNLIYILEMEEPVNAIVFCNTRDDTELVTAVLNRNGFDTELLNGDLPQKERERVMAKVKRGEVSFMVATDIAARGIDISDLGHVINYSLPEDPAVYLHRVGRTGRIGKKGVAINLVSGRELTTFTTLEKKFNITFEKRAMPLPEEANRLWMERHVREIREVSSGVVYDGFLTLAAQLKARGDSEDLIAFLLKYFFTHHRMEKVAAMMAAEGRTPAVRLSDTPRESGGKGKGGRKERAPREGRSERPREDRPPREAREERAPREASRGEERPRRRERETPLVPQAGQARLWMSLGKAEGLDDASLRGTLESLGAPAGKLVALSVLGTFSYGIVAEEDVAAFESITGKEHNGRKVKVERARDPSARRAEGAEGEAAGGVRLWVNLGKTDGVDEATFVQALEAQGAPGGKVTRVQLRDSYSYAFVEDADVSAFESLSGKQHGEKALKVERSKRR